MREVKDMSYAIVYSSLTGNTAILAEELKKILPENQCVYFGEPDKKALEADIIYAGFWTDKGTCDEKSAEFLSQLTVQKIFLFGTAGFGGSDEYFQQILSKIKENIPASVSVTGTFMCQGKMPQSVRTRYEKMEKSPKQKLMLDNFDRALSHPDKNDIDNLKMAVTR